MPTPFDPIKSFNDSRMKFINDVKVEFQNEAKRKQILEQFKKLKLTADDARSRFNKLENKIKELEKQTWGDRLKVFESITNLTQGSSELIKTLTEFESLKLKCFIGFALVGDESTIEYLLQVCSDIPVEVIESAVLGGHPKLVYKLAKSNADKTIAIKTALTTKQYSLINSLLNYDDKLSEKDFLDIFKDFPWQAKVDYQELAVHIDSMELRNCFLEKFFFTAYLSFDDPQLPNDPQFSKVTKSNKLKFIEQTTQLNQLMRNYAIDFKTAQNLAQILSIKGVSGWLRQGSAACLADGATLSKDLFLCIASYVTGISSADTEKVLDIVHRNRSEFKKLAAFKEAFITDYNARFFKNSFGMMQILNSGKIKTLADLEKIINDNPTSQAAKIYKSLTI